MENGVSENKYSYIDGAISVKAVVESESRDIKKIYISEKKLSDRNIRYIISLAEKKKIKTEKVNNAFFESENFGKTNGGIAALAAERKYVPAESLFTAKTPFIAIIEGVEDPYNFGAALRSLLAAGATGVVLPERNWMNAASTVIKSSAGASEILPTAAVNDFEPFLKKAREMGIEIIAAERKNAQSIFETDMTQPLILAIGGEKRGLSKKISDNVTKNVFIPYGSDFRNSLGTAAAASVFAFEILRQRRYK